MTLIEEIERIIKPPIEQLHLRLFDVSLQYENSVHYLRILIEHPSGKGISLDDIVQVTETLSPLLDQANLIQHSYTLDVASSGAEHEIEISSLSDYVDRWVKITFHQPMEGEMSLTGQLKRVEEKQILVEYRVKTRTKAVMIPIQNIKKANLAIH